MLTRTARPTAIPITAVCVRSALISYRLGSDFSLASRTQIFTRRRGSSRCDLTRPAEECSDPPSDGPRGLFVGPEVAEVGKPLDLRPGQHIGQPGSSRFSPCAARCRLIGVRLQRQSKRTSIS